MIAVKICGLCRPQDAAAAASAGAEYVGVILAPDTRRTQSLSAAARILEAAGAARRVGVFVDPEPQDIFAAVAELSLDVVQLHGTEAPVLAQELSERLTVWKAVRIRSPLDLQYAAQAYPRVAALLLDAFDPGQAGGTGRPLDWAGLVEARRALPAELPLVLAGGLTAANVAQAIQLLSPDVVDVSSGVERVPGEKSPDRITAFLAAVRQLPSGNAHDAAR
jgi:phosphoribosylanthranilate isomerase